MIAVDTNVVIRFLTHDDEVQFERAYELFKEESIFIPDTVILESEWVLRYAYDFNSADITIAFTKLFGLRNVQLSNPGLIAMALEWHKQGLDFADAIHLANCQQKQQLATFDKVFVREAQGMGKCQVVLP